MSQDYSNKLDKRQHKLVMAIALPTWFLASFFIAQAVLFGLVWLLNFLHISISALNPAVVNTIMSVLLYVITLALVCVPPLLIKRSQISKTDLGFTRLPSWMDILITPAGLIIYLILSSLLMLVATHFMNWVDVNQVQNTGFNHLNQSYEYILAFITLVIAAPIAEETLFRGYLYGKLKKYVPFWAAMLITSALFGMAHGQWDLGIDTFALSLVLCWLRESTGSLWASILLHMTKNGIAFYFLFINPLLLAIMVK